jgi:hypothetical protein
MGMNRQQGRRKVVKKFYRDADDKIGVRHTRKGAPHRTPRPSIWGLTHTPSEDSTKSNHQRHIERQKTRELASH